MLCFLNLVRHLQGELASVLPVLRHMGQQRQLEHDFQHCLQRLLDTSVPLPQELIQAQKGLPKQAQQAVQPSVQRDDAVAAQHNFGAGQEARGPAKAAKTRRRVAMHDSGEPHFNAHMQSLRPARPCRVCMLMSSMPSACS